jgi:excisionase family DNA binding protein
MPRKLPVPTPEPRLATLLEASAYTARPEDGIAGIPPRTIRDWVSRGVIPGYRFGPRQLRVDLNDIDALIVRVATVAS